MGAVGGVFIERQNRGGADARSSINLRDLSWFQTRFATNLSKISFWRS
jgi:hypothetical protein